MKTTYHRLIKWVLCWEICPKFGYLCGRTEMLLVRSISREMQIWHSFTQGQILRWKKKSLDWSRARKIYSSWRCTPILHVMMCVWIRYFACPRQTKESHLLTVIQWPFFLSLKQYVSPIRFPNSSEEDSEPSGLIGECILAMILLLERQPKLPTVGTQPLR